MDSQLRAQVADLVRLHGGQEALAKLLDVHQSTISRYLSGQKDLSISFARALVRAFPGLRNSVETTIFLADDMRTPLATNASCLPTRPRSRRRVPA